MSIYSESELDGRQIAISATIDYELFGDGSGDIRRHILEPTNRLLGFFGANDIRATFFIETAELYAMKKSIDNTSSNRNLSVEFSQIIDQLEQIVREGHDIQLHIHPQWLNAEMRSDEWFLPQNHGSLLKVDGESLEEVIKWGKDFLDSIGHKIAPNYSCRIFRAGGLHYDRSVKTGELLLGQGILCDSSICRGYHRLGPLSNIDNRDLINVRDPYWYTLDGSPVHKDKFSLLEIPIWSDYRKQIWKINTRSIADKLYAIVNGVHPSRVAKQAGITGNIFSWKDWIFTKQAMPWDFCLLSFSQMRNLFQKALCFHAYSEDFIPLVMIGHTKSLPNLKSFSNFIDYTKSLRNISWQPLSEVVRNVTQ